MSNNRSSTQTISIFSHNEKKIGIFFDWLTYLVRDIIRGPFSSQLCSLISSTWKHSPQDSCLQQCMASIALVSIMLLYDTPSKIQVHLLLFLNSWEVCVCVCVCVYSVLSCSVMKNSLCKRGGKENLASRTTKTGYIFQHIWNKGVYYLKCMSSANK